MTKLSDRLRAELKKRDLSQAWLAEATGYSEPAIQKILAGKTARPGNAVHIAEVLDIPWTEMEELMLDAEATAGGVAASPRPAAQRSPLTRPHDTIPVLGRAAGGIDNMIIAQTPTEYIPTPIELMGVENAYALDVIGYSMVPMYKPGWRVHVHPFRQLLREEGVVLQLMPENGVLPEGYVKEFVEWTPTEIVVKQYNPETTLRFPRKRILAAHLIVGTSRI